MVRVVGFGSCWLLAIAAIAAAAPPRHFCMLLAGIHFDLGLLPSACSLIMDNIAPQFSISVLEFGFAVAAHAHNTVVLSVLVLGALSEVFTADEHISQK